MAKVNWKGGTLLAPLPAVMVTCGDMENSNIITIGWTGIVNTHPPMTYISVRPSRHSFGILMEKREFVINLPDESLAAATDFSGIYTGAKVDKFEKLSLTKMESKEVAAPTIAECPLSLECKVFEVIESGTHHIFMADIVNVSAKEELFDENGRLSLGRAKLIAYAHGEYYALGESLGRFGFSADKRGKLAEREKKEKLTDKSSVAKEKTPSGGVGDKKSDIKEKSKVGTESKGSKDKKRTGEGKTASAKSEKVAADDKPALSTVSKPSEKTFKVRDGRKIPLPVSKKKPSRKKGKG